MILPILALAATPAQIAPGPGTKIPTLAIRRVLWLPTTASYTTTDAALSPKFACDGANIGLTSSKAPYLPVNMDEVKAAVKTSGLKSATGGSPEGSAENWSSEGAMKLAKGFKADYYGLVKVTEALRVEIAGQKSVEVRARIWLYDASGKPVAENVPLRARDKAANPNAREAAFELARTDIAEWYKTTMAK